MKLTLSYLKYALVAVAALVLFGCASTESTFTCGHMAGHPSAFKHTVYYFAHDSAAIQSQDMPALQKIADILKMNPEQYVLVAGYASSVGNAAYNKRLGMRRAKAIANALINYGVNSSMIVIHTYGERNITDNDVGYGEHQPAKPGHAADRKVIIGYCTNSSCTQLLPASCYKQ